MFAMYNSAVPELFKNTWVSGRVCNAYRFVTLDESNPAILNCGSLTIASGNLAHH